MLLSSGRDVMLRVMVPLKPVLLKIKVDFIDPYLKRVAVKRSEKMHLREIARLRKKKKVKVVFLVVHHSVWKVDQLFRRMENDELFEPKILICPNCSVAEPESLDDLNQAYNYFLTRGYSVIKGLKNDGSWLTLQELSPDIVFFTNPHNLTHKEYFEYAYKNYLSCYVPYYFMATHHAGEESLQLNTFMLCSMWRTYWPHPYIYDRFVQFSTSKGKGARSVGYPATEPLLSANCRVAKSAVWKSQESTKKKIIYAPHHTILDNQTQLSTFLRFGDFVKCLAVKYKNETQWSFKPHPLLKSKLYLHPDWGRERTDQYYEFWTLGSNTQLEDGSYDDLFLQSDAIIHDCSSFIIEYAFTGKPALYLLNNTDGGLAFLNDFGKSVFEVYQVAASSSGVKEFLMGVIMDKWKGGVRDAPDFDRYLNEFYGSEMPSARIVKDIKVSLGVGIY